MSRYIDDINKLLQDAVEDPEKLADLAMTLQQGLAVAILTTDPDAHEKLLDSIRPNVKHYIDTVLEHSTKVFLA